jgi:protoporphyrin/coproporphyrin ferrochelatase
MSTTGVLLMAYGSPASLDELEAYYTHIRRGRAPEAAQLAELRARYEAIGGVSRLRARTDEQAAAIQAALDDAHPGGFTVRLGMKHAPPFIEDAVEAMAHDGIERAVAAVLAPHYSGASVGEYLARARATGETVGIEMAAVEQWFDLPAHHDFLVRAVTDARSELPPRTKVFFTAHSLPVRVLQDDPYPSQLDDGARAVATEVGLAPFSEWAVCWQSAGRTPEPWAGPDILRMIEVLAETGRADAALVCPHGFVADHLEVAYDLDIEARRVAEQAGLQFARTTVVNADPAVMAALAERIAGAAATLMPVP